MLCRKRYIDEKLTGSAVGIGAVVNIGAGFDTRLCRLQALAHMPAWETDQRANIEDKRKRLRELFGSIPKHVTLLAIDFDREELGVALAASGFPAGVPTFFIWEAVMQYLTEPAVRATFDFLGKAAKGSRLAFTYVRKDFIEGHVLYGQEDMYKRYVEKSVWLFGMDPGEVPKFLLSYGWRLVEDLDYGALAERYVKPTGRQLKSTPVERIVYAEKL
jgi:methyltransferase (TIGR00027 family)